MEVDQKCIFHRFSPSVGLFFWKPRVKNFFSLLGVELVLIDARSVILKTSPSTKIRSIESTFQHQRFTFVLTASFISCAYDACHGFYSKRIDGWSSGRVLEYDPWRPMFKSQEKWDNFILLSAIWVRFDKSFVIGGMIHSIFLNETPV